MKTIFDKMNIEKSTYV